MGHTGMMYLEYDKHTKTLLRAVPKTIKASKFPSKNEYWKAIIKNIEKCPYDFLVVENYKQAEGNATTETSELIGAIEFTEPKLYKQWNHEIKQPRFKEDNLVRRGIIDKVNRFYKIDGKQLDGHGRDALRHGLKFICKSTGHALKEMRIAWKIKK